MLPPLHIFKANARHFMRRALLIDEPVNSIDSVVAHHGYVQIDPINVCGRMHDLILRNRVVGYREGDLMRHLHGDEGMREPTERTAFEHHMPDRTNILVAFPLEAWPHLLAAMRHRSRSTGAWSGRLTPREKILAEHILAEISGRGALSSDDIEDTRKSRRVWGASTLAKSTLQKLFFHGRVLISRRISQRRVYDLPERVLPHAILASPVPAADDTARWLATLKLRQRRLVTLKRQEIRAVEDLVQPVVLRDLDTTDARVPLFILKEDVPLLEKVVKDSAKPPESVHLLAPLDPVIYDRRVTSQVWDFDYTWEAYTPPHKRIRGYYALPILSGLEIVGHVDAKADRPNRKLLVTSRRVKRGHGIAGTMKTFSTWLGLK
ncbi:MAG: crosslink repair DNA glycosylase YcaQ family protein [Opitutus sp.]